MKTFRFLIPVLSLETWTTTVKAKDEYEARKMIREGDFMEEDVLDEYLIANTSDHRKKCEYALEPPSLASVDGNRYTFHIHTSSVDICEHSVMADTSEEAEKSVREYVAANEDTVLPMLFENAVSQAQHVHVGDKFDYCIYSLPAMRLEMAYEAIECKEENE